MTGITVSVWNDADQRRRWGRRLRRFPWFAVLLLAPMLICGIFGPWLYPHDPTSINLLDPHKPPSWLAGSDPDFLLGTDQFGRDMLSRLIEGARIALLVCLCGVALAAVIGITAGLVAGYYGGWIDNLIMRLVDAEMSIPPILLTLLIGGAIGGGLATVLSSIVILFWVNYARVIRGQTLALRELEYVALARVANCSDWRIITRHILPNLMATCVVLITLQVGGALLVESAITFLGLGIQPPHSAWGLLIAEGRAYIDSDWWIPTFPGLCISFTVLGANLFGDWLRDALDPKLRQL